MAARIPDFPDSYFPKGANLYIDSIFDENNPEIYVYIEGMDNSKKIC